MNMETKSNYEAPEIEIIRMEAEQVLAVSGNINQWDQQDQIDDNVYGR